MFVSQDMFDSATAQLENAKAEFAAKLKLLEVARMEEVLGPTAKHGSHRTP